MALRKSSNDQGSAAMNGADLLRIVEQMHRDKNIPREVIFEGIEAALQLATEKHYGEEEGIAITIDRDSGEIKALRGEQVIDPTLLGRIAAQSAKQVMIQKIREAECKAIFDEYVAMKGDLVHGTVQRFEGGAATVTLGKSEAILPRGEQIPGETHHVGERVKAVILEVRQVGHRVKIILSRTHPDFVRRLFENEIPEIADRTIEIKALAREAGYRSKIAVSSIDLKVDCVGACVGVRGSRIKNIVDELGGERIDIVRWNDSLQVMIPNALQPAQIEDVFLYQRLGRAIVLVNEDQLSLAIGRRGQNVRLASKLVGWDIEIMTHDELNEGIEKAENWFGQIPHVTPELVEAFIEEGFLSYDDLTFLEPAQLAELAGLTEEQAEEIIAFAEEGSERVEEENRLAREAEAEARANAPAEEAQQGASPAASDLFPAEAATQPADAKPTLESLFGPDTPPAAEASLSAEQLFGTTSATATQNDGANDEGRPAESAE
jgi:N utilization substance protein A